MAQIQAPFTPEQVHHLNAYQQTGSFHPFTCANSKHGNLIATTNGWICRNVECVYEQNWAHDFMANGMAIEQHKAMLAQLEKGPNHEGN